MSIEALLEQFPITATIHIERVPVDPPEYKVGWSVDGMKYRPGFGNYGPDLTQEVEKALTAYQNYRTDRPVDESD